MFICYLCVACIPPPECEFLRGVCLLLIDTIYFILFSKLYCVINTCMT